MAETDQDADVEAGRLVEPRGQREGLLFRFALAVPAIIGCSSVSLEPSLRKLVPFFRDAVAQSKFCFQFCF